MREAKKVIQRVLSVLLAAAMVITTVPDISMTTYAAQTDESTTNEKDEVTESSVKEEKSGFTAIYDEVISEDTTMQTSTLEDSYTINFNISAYDMPEELLSQVEIQDITGTANLGTTVIAAKGDFSFHIKLPEGYTVTSVKGPKGWAIKKDYVNSNYTLSVKKYYEESADVNIYISKIANYELCIDYPESIGSIEILQNENTVEFKDGKAVVSNVGNTVLKVRPTGSYLVKAVYETESDEYPIGLEQTATEADGTQCFDLGIVGENISIVLSTEEAVKVSFDVGEDVSGYFWQSSTEQSLSEVSGVRYFTTGKTLVLWLDYDSEKAESHSLQITSIVGEESTSEKLVYDYDAEQYKCNITLKEDTVIKVQWVPRKTHKVKFVIENVDVYKGMYDEYEEKYESGTEYEVCSGDAVQFQLDTGKMGEDNYKLVTLSTKEDGALDLNVKRYYEEDEGCYYSYYEVVPTEDTTIYIKAVPKEQYTVQFNVTNATIDGENFEDQDGVTKYTLYEGNYLFAVEADEGYKVDYVSTTGDETGIVGQIFDSECQGNLYYLPVNSDTTVTVKTVPREQYTVKFEGEHVSVEDVSGIIEQDSSDETGNTYTIYESGKLSFRIVTEEGYQLANVSATDATGATEQALYPVENATSGGRDFAVNIGQDTVIKIETMEKTPYTVKFETENASVQVIDGNELESGEGYRAYAEDIFVFTVTAETDYVVDTVTVKGETEQLNPIYDAINDIWCYELVPEKDTTISVSAKKAEKHTISFTCEDEITLSVWSEDGQSYTVTDGSVTVSSAEEVWFNATTTEGTIAKVVCKDGSGAESTIWKTYDVGGKYGYYIGNVKSDTEVTVSKGSVYRVKFLGNYSRERIVPLNGKGVFTNGGVNVGVNVPDGEVLDFKIISADGYKIEDVTVSGSIKLTGSKETGIYQAEQKESGYLGVSTVSVSSGETGYSDLKFYYPEEEVDLKVYVGNEQIALADGKITLPKQLPFTIKIKPIADKLVKTFDYEYGEYESEPDLIEEDGTMVYEVSGGLASIGNDYFRVLTYDYNTVDFKMEHAGILVYKYDYFEGNGIWEEADDSFKVKAGNEIRFRVNLDNGYRMTSISTTEDESGTLSAQVKYDYLEETYYSYYSFIPTEDTTVTIKTEVIPYNKINFDYDSSKASLYIADYEYYPYEDWYELYWNEGSSVYKQYKSNTKDIWFKVVPAEGYRVSLVSTTKDKTGQLPQGCTEDEETYYYLPNTADATVTIKVEPISSYELTFEYPTCIENVTIRDADWTYYELNEGKVTVSNKGKIYITPTMETEAYTISSVKANGVELQKVVDYEGEETYYILDNFYENQKIVIETAVNEKCYNVINLDVDGDEGSYQAALKLYSEEDDREYVSPYKTSGDKLYVVGKNAKVVLQASDGYAITKVEFTRAGKVQTITAGEGGIYKIAFPLSRTLSGNLKVYTVSTKKEVQSVKICYDAEKVELQSVNVAGQKITDISSNVNTVGMTEAVITVPRGEKVQITAAAINKYKILKLVTAKGENSEEIQVNDVSSVYEMIADVDTVVTIISKRNYDENTLTVALEGITEGKVSQTVDTAKEYKITFNQDAADSSMLGVEVTAADGTATDKVKAEIADDCLKLTTAVGKETADAAVVKLYNTETSTTEKREYISGGTFTVSTVRPTALEEGATTVELKKSDDVSVTVTLTAPSGVEPSIEGRQYYKIMITPQNVSGKEIPESIKEATVVPYYIEKEAADSQTVRLLVNSMKQGSGQAWKFDVTALLVQTKDATALDSTTENEKVVYKSKEGVLKDVATKDPCYEVKLTLKSKAKQIYTTQENVAAAQVVFSKNTGYTEIEEVKDITELNGKGGALQVWEKDGMIYASAAADTMLGKHTIEATAYGPESMYKTKATLVVNVVKGIEQMEVSVPVNSVYKAAGKATSLKAAVSYNTGDVPAKTKKVTWEIVNRDGEAFVKGDALYGMLTVKNGKVSVNKSFSPSETTTDNQFRIKAKAADFEGNTTCAVSEIITLTSKAAEIGAVYIVVPGADGYEVVAKEGSVITSDKLKNAFVVALNKDAEKKDSYTEEELAKWQLSTGILSYKTSNKAVTVEKNSEKVTLSAAKAAKNVKLTVSTNDGGKKKAVMKFTVAYAEPEALALEFADANQAALGETGAKEVTFAGTTNTKLTVRVKQKTAEGWENLNALVNYKFTVKNGKIITADNVNGIYEIIVTGKTAQITLDNKTTGKTAKDIYAVTNSAYSEARALKVKTGGKLVAGALENRKVTYTIKSTYDCRNKYVLAEIDWTARTKNADAYKQFEEAATNLNVWIPVKADGTFALTFAGTEVPVGSYKLKLTFGTGNTPESFVADAKPTAVTLKAAKPKATKGSFKAVTSYKIEAAPGAKVTLSGKGKNIVENSVVFYDLKNANIKGSENQFLSYFELKDNKLYLKKDLKEEQLAELKSKAGKNNLTGYVSYTVAYGNDGYGNPYTVTRTVKITVKLK